MFWLKRRKIRVAILGSAARLAQVRQMNAAGVNHLPDKIDHQGNINNI